MTTLGDLDARAFQVVIIGGGANGAAAADALARVGYGVLLVEREDFGSGTTSRSSRMLHCGFRSLEGVADQSWLQRFRKPGPLLNAIRGAREQLHARADYVSAFPERCRPITLMMPLLAGGVAGYQMDLAAMLLSCLGTKGVPLDYRRIRADKAGDLPFAEWLTRRPDLREIVTFRDYVFDWPERICVDLAASAEKQGAIVRNHTHAEAMVRLPSGGYRITLRDRATQATATVAAELVLNLAGPWIDQVLGSTSPQLQPRIAMTKGTQIAVRLPERYANHGFVMNTSKGAHVCIPSQGLHLIGATNGKFSDDPASAAPTDAEIDDLIARTNDLMPGLDLDRSSLCYAIAGVRPGTKGSAGRAIIDHAAEGFEGLISVSGGTVGTSRTTAQLLQERVANKIGAPSQAVRALSSAAAPHLLEHAATLSDIVFRRTGEGWGTELSLERVEAHLQDLSRDRAWSRDEAAAELARFRAELSSQYRRVL